MRTTLALLGLGLGVAVSVLPVTPASASCTIELNDHCYNVCTLLLAPYGIADHALGDKSPLPDDVNCPA